MSKMKELQVMVEEVARIALEDEATLTRVAHELGLEEEELQRLSGYLNSLVDPSFMGK